MGLWRRLTTAFARKGTDWGMLERWLMWRGGGPSASGIQVNAQSAMQAAAVYSCIKVLSESVGMLPCNLLRKVGKGTENATDHPLFSLLHDQPNDYQTAPEFWEMMIVHLCLRGNGYAYVNRTKSKEVAELLPLDPDSVRPEMQTNHQMAYHVTLVDGSERRLQLGEIMHLRGMSINGWLGVSPIAYARESIGLALAAERFGSLLFKNGAKMGGVLEHPGKLSDDAYKRLKESFDAASSGDNAHKSALLEEGMKFTKVSMSSEDAQFLETRKYQRSEIASLYRVPPHMIGDLEKATFGNIEQQSLEFATYSLMPWLVRIEKTVKRDLLSRDERKELSLKFKTAAIMRGDAKSRSDYYASGIVNGWLTRNEAREAEAESGVALNPLTGLDEPLKPLNMIGANEKPPAPTGSTAEPGAGGAPQNPAASKPTDGSGKSLEAFADSMASLAIAVARQPAPVVNVEGPRIDLAGATIHHPAQPAVPMEFEFDAEGNITGARPVT